MFLFNHLLLLVKYLQMWVYNSLNTIPEVSQFNDFLLLVKCLQMWVYNSLNTIPDVFV